MSVYRGVLSQNRNVLFDQICYLPNRAVACTYLYFWYVPLSRICHTKLQTFSFSWIGANFAQRRNFWWLHNHKIRKYAIPNEKMRSRFWRNKIRQTTTCNVASTYSVILNTHHEIFTYDTFIFHTTMSDMVKHRAALWSFLKLTALVFYNVWHSPWIN